MPKSKSLGRESKYKPEYCELLIKHFEEGLSFKSFAGVVGVCKQTLFTWVKEHPDFAFAKALGEPRAQLWWEREGQKGLWIEKGGPTFNTTAWIFNMKNRFAWKDRVENTQKIQVTAEDIKKMSLEELYQFVSKILGQIEGQE